MMRISSFNSANMLKTLFISINIFAFIFLPLWGAAQAPPIQWQKTLGGNGDDLLFDLIQTTDGGYVAVGRSASGISGDKTETSRGQSDIWVVKLDANGVKQWDKTIGTTGNDHAANVWQTADGGYMIGGAAGGGGGDRTVPVKGANGDYWIVKLNGTGTIVQWQAAYGGNQANTGYTFTPARNGSYYINGFANANVSADKTQNSRGTFDMWQLKIDNNGAMVWDRTIGGNDWDAALVSCVTVDNGFVSGGYSRSGISGEKTEANRGGIEDFWMTKVDSNGNLRWDKTLGGSGSEIMYVLQQTPDSGYIVGGPSASGISGDKTEASRGSNDFWFLRLDTGRNILWQKTFGGSGDDQLFTTLQTPDGGYLLGGNSSSGISGERTEASQGSFDYWILKLNSSGNIQWQKAFGGSGSDNLRIMRRTSDGGYILGGYSTSSISGDKTENSRGGSTYGDFWIIKLGRCDTTVQVTDSFCRGGNYRRPRGGVVSAPGIYYDTLSNVRGCDSVVITDLAYYPENMAVLTADILGLDTVLCTGQSLTLNATVPGTFTYLWNTGATTSSITVTQANQYSVEITSVNGCIGRDTVDVTFLHQPVVDLGPDRGACDHDLPLTLSSIQPVGTTYLWSDGLSNATIQVTRTGYYWLQAAFGKCQDGDTVYITIVPTPQIYIGADTIICEQTPLRIGMQMPDVTYTWSTGATTPYIHVNSTNDYILAVNYQGCVVTDTIKVMAMPAPSVDLGEDRDICTDQVIPLNGTASGSINYQWNTGDVTPVYNAIQAGTYWVRVQSEYGCVSSDTIVLTYAAKPTIVMNSDTVVCEETPLTLMPAYVINEDSLLWSTGSTARQINITEGGVYILQAMNKCGVVADTISVKQIFCDIWLPNAFTPNGDALNDKYKVLGNIGRLEGFELSLYNRWGQCVFRTRDKHSGWDGIYNGGNAAVGTYVYMLNYTLKGKPVMQKGNFHLLR